MKQWKGILVSGQSASPGLRKAQAEDIQIVADGPRMDTSLVVYDNGEGQRPEEGLLARRASCPRSTCCALPSPPREAGVESERRARPGLLKGEHNG